MQFKLSEIEKVILCTLACFQISCTQQPRCSTFAMKFFGSLREDRAKPLWDIEKESVGSVMHSCFPRCERDQQCSGVEICTIRPDLARCRGCCEWFVIDKDGGLPRNTSDGCKYFELICVFVFNYEKVRESSVEVRYYLILIIDNAGIYISKLRIYPQSKDSVESRGTKWSANSDLSAVSSSTYIDAHWAEFPASNVLDGLYGIKCKYRNVYNSNSETNPWLEVTWSGTIIIWRIKIYNRVDCCGYRLVNLNVTYQNNGVTGICSFYPGLLSLNGDIILLYCPPEAHATSVKLQIHSKPAEHNMLNLCEVEINKKG